MVRVLFVCLGNICRSPTAEGVFRKVVADAGLAQAIDTRSAGTHAYHVGEGADPRSTRAARRRGYDLSAHSARRVHASDFDDFDYVLAMDRENLRHLEAVAGSERSTRRAHVAMFLGFAPAVKFDEVPDPYSRGEEGFEMVLDMIESAADGLLEHIRREDLARGVGDPPKN
ncbi:MAG: low molecular weight protein-tyrosine-phosphatase [Candidatus Binatia bacterium]